jgi:hypothetical protein
MMAAAILAIIKASVILFLSVLPSVSAAEKPGGGRLSGATIVDFR